MEEEVKDPQAVLAELRRAQADLTALRDELKAKSEELTKANEQLANDTWRAKALVAEVKAALTSQGIKDVDKVMKYVSTDGLDFDDEGKVSGLSDKLKEWQQDLPAVFDPKTRAGGKADAFASTTAQPQVDPMREAVRAAITN